MHKYILIVLAVLFSGVGASAYTQVFQDSVQSHVLQSVKDSSHAHDSLHITARQKKDTVVKRMVRGSNGLIVMPQEEIQYFSLDVTFRDTIIINPAYLPVVFSGELIPEDLDLRTKSKRSDKKSFELINDDETFAPLLKTAEDLKNLRNMYAVVHPDKVKYKMRDLRAQREVRKEEEKIIASRNVFQDLIKAEAVSSLSKPEVEKVVPKRIYWLKNGEHKLQVSQNHITDNWYKGGNSNFAVKNEHLFTLNYAKDKVKFDNTLEWRLSFQKTPADTLRSITITEDLVRLKSVFGYKAFNKWYYSSSLLTETQLFNSYPINSDERRTALFAPLKVELGIGMTYSLEKSFESDKYKKVRYSIDLAPLSGKMVYVGDDKVSKREGVEDGKTTKLDYGSKVESSLTFSFNRYTTWTSRFKYFTNYEYVEGEFENKLDLALNRYLSTTLYLYLRYDDRGTKDSTFGHIQMYEMVSFGLNYKW